MNYFYEPVNVKQWNIFEKVKSVGHIEPFLATNAMRKGDVILLHVGSQVKKYQSGVYAIGKVVREPYILENSPKDYCNNKNTVDVEIVAINYTTPFIPHEKCVEFINQFRRVNKIDSRYYNLIEDMLK